MRDIMPEKIKQKITFTRICDMGRLGNQMFQYALLYAIHRKNGSKIYVNWEDGAKYFNIPQESPKGSFRIFKEKLSQGYQPEVFFQEGNIDFEGYFQSEKYFKRYKEDIAKLYTFEDCYLKKAQSIISMANQNLERLIVCHFRGGDYYFLDNFGILSFEYYYRAIKYISEIDELDFDDYTILVVTDDLKLAKKVFGVLPNIKFTSNNEIIDLSLLKEARRLVISHSTFAWWGAWLNTKENIVVAPKYWIFGSSQNRKRSKKRGINSQWYPEDIKVDEWHYLLPNFFLYNRKVIFINKIKKYIYRLVLKIKKELVIFDKFIKFMKIKFF